MFGLEPGEAYAYTVRVDGAAVARPYPTEIRTQPLWQYRTDPPETTIAFGSCFYDNDAPYDRPGEPYGGATGIFESVRTAGPEGRAPDAMLWLGDNLYLREIDWWSPDGIDDRYANSRAFPDLQPLLAATPHYATWDDHDYGPNNSDRSYIHKDAALDTFQRYWPNPTYGTTASGACSRSSRSATPSCSCSTTATTARRTTRRAHARFSARPS